MRTVLTTFATTILAILWLTDLACAQEVTPLEPGKTITRTAKAREVHTYQLTLTAGQLIRVSVEQSELDVAVELVAPDNKVSHSVNAIRYFGPESLSWEVMASGKHKLIIRVIATSLSPQGDYQVQLEVRDAATPQDKQRIAAERLLGEMGSSSFTTLAVEQRLEKYQQTLRSWRALNDRQAEAHTHDVMAAIYFGGKHYEQARECLKQSLAIKEEMQDHLGRVVTLSTLGQFARFEGNTTEARDTARGQQLLKIDEDYQQQALALSRTIKHRGAERFILNSLGGELQRTKSS
jgi:tetratricopeptide (TPR) repeat protein